jgi:hypothetical protein
MGPGLLIWIERSTLKPPVMLVVLFNAPQGIQEDVWGRMCLVGPNSVLDVDLQVHARALQCAHHASTCAR